MRDRKHYFPMIILFSAAAFWACDKYEGEISGEVVYTDMYGTQQVAAGAIMSKVQLKGGNETVVAKQETDSNGRYVFDYTTKGSWKVKGRLEMDSLVYEGVSETVTINGTRKEVRDLVLLPVQNERHNE